MDKEHFEEKWEEMKKMTGQNPNEATKTLCHGFFIAGETRGMDKALKLLKSMKSIS